MNEDLKLKILHSLFPSKCASCHKIIAYNEILCEECKEEFVKLKGERCSVCLNPKDMCDCKRVPKFYSKSIVPFAYEKSAKGALLTLKTCKNKRLAEFFGEKIAESVKEKLKDLKLDAVIPVPLYKRSYNARGYNQSELIAKAIADRLDIPLLPDVLIARKKSSPQHNLKYKERYINVKGAYETNSVPIEINKILLVDDIMTTGATLNECEKMLRLEGIVKIYCAAVAKSV